VYKPGTILSRNEPYEPPEDEHADDLTPYNEIEVIGQSPIQTNVRAGEWVGGQSDKVSVKPTTFGDVVDKPQGELETDYTIVSEPPKRRPLTHTVEVVEPGPAPEQVFRAEQEHEASQTREQTPLATV
jgi:hypothetical protein